MICQADLYLNPETNDVSTSPKKDYIKGCGCVLVRKVVKEFNHCPAKKW